MSGSSHFRLAAVRSALGARELVWFGTRGIDALPLWQLRAPALVVAQIAPIGGNNADEDNLETRSRLRRDLDQYDIDADFGVDAAGLKSEFLVRLDAPVCLVAYRTADLLCRSSFCHPDLLLAAPFFLTQRQFEHKPWVETQLAMLEGIHILASTFIRDNDFNTIRRLLQTGPLVGRCSTGSGGAGVFRFHSEEEYVASIPEHSDGFLGVAPFLEGAKPLNLNACVYDAGETTVFGVSYQLIGIHGLTRREFGYCGNDFACAAGLPVKALEQAEFAARTIGRWLHRLGYRGLFGLDLLLTDRHLFVTEVNARFQASTALSSIINQSLGLPDPMTEHIAAFLGMEAPAMPTVVEQARAAASLIGEKPVAQVVHRNISAGRLRFVEPNHAAMPIGASLIGTPAAGVYVDREAMIAKSMHCHAVTETGYSVLPHIEAAKDALRLTAF